METLLNYFETIPSFHRGIIIVGGLTFFWLIEGAMPLFNFKYKKWKHAVPNIFFTITTILVNMPLAFLLLMSSDWAVANDFGVLHWLPDMSLGLYIVVGLFLMDFIGAYLHT